jgi:DNA-directed RNA polymerase specialized sigma24 family protein
VSRRRRDADAGISVPEDLKTQLDRALVALQAATDERMRDAGIRRMFDLAEPLVRRSSLAAGHQDLVPEVLARVLQKTATPPPGFIAAPNRLAYLRRLIANCWKTLLKRLQRSGRIGRASVTGGSSLDDREAGEGPGAGDLVMERDQAEHMSERLLTALGGLRAIYADLVLCVLLGSESREDYCRRLAISPNCFRVRLHRARAALRPFLRVDAVQ